MSKNSFPIFEECKKTYDDIMSAVKNEKEINIMIQDSTGAFKAVSLDKAIAPVVKLLNDHGFETIHCCEGHFLGKDGEKFFGHESYISIVDNSHKTTELEFLFLPDFLGNYIIRYETLNGPKSVEEMEFIDKFILRFQYLPSHIIKDKQQFENDKIEFFEMLVDVLEKHL